MTLLPKPVKEQRVHKPARESQNRPQKPHRPRWCSQCKDYKEWGKTRVLGARAGFKGCLTCGGRTSPRKPVKFGGKKKRPPSEWNRLKKQADELWRTIVKVPGVCAHSGKTKDQATMEGAHGFSRVYYRTRWLTVNGWCLSAGSHAYFTKRPDEWTDWMIAFWARTDFAGFSNAIDLAKEKHQELKRLAYSSETNPVKVEELREIVEQLKNELACVLKESA